MTDHRRDMRATDADREQVVRHLRRAADEGRLRVEEFDDRLGRALNARTYAQLDAIVRDLPADRRVLTQHPTLSLRRPLRGFGSVRHAGRIGIVVGSPQRAIIAGALAAVAAAAPLAARGLEVSRGSVRIPHTDSRRGNGSFLYDWREENNPNAPHPPILKANQGQK